MAKLDRSRRQTSTANISNTLNTLLDDQPVSRYQTAIKGNRISEDANSLLRLDDSSAEVIDRNRIYPNPINAPYMEGITPDVFKALKASILEMGMMHNLVVLDDGKGRYRLISGEKRWTSIGLMTDEEYSSRFPGGILCKVIPFNPNLTHTDEAIMVLTCNVLVFSNGSPDPRQVRDLIRLYLKKGYEKQELVVYLAANLQNSSKTVYKMIDESKAIDEFVDLYDEKRMQRTALQCLGGLPVEDQKKIYQRILAEGIPKVDEKLAMELKKSLKSARKNGNPDSQGNSTAFLKMNKSLSSVIAGLDKGNKMNLKGLSAMETELALSRLDKIDAQLKDLRLRLQEEMDALRA